MFYQTTEGCPPPILFATSSSLRSALENMPMWLRRVCFLQNSFLGESVILTLSPMAAFIPTHHDVPVLVLFSLNGAEQIRYLFLGSGYVLVTFVFFSQGTSYLRCATPIPDLKALLIAQGRFLT